MSYICTGSDGFTLPVICHCQLVPGFGCHIRDVAWGVTVPIEVGRLGAEGDGTVADVALTDERGFGDDSRVGDDSRIGDGLVADDWSLAGGNGADFGTGRGASACLAEQPATRS